MSSSAARALDDDQLVFGALLPAVHGRFTSSRSYLSPDLSSSYRVAFIIFWCAAPAGCPHRRNGRRSLSPTQRRAQVQKTETSLPPHVSGEAGFNRQRSARTCGGTCGEPAGGSRSGRLALHFRSFDYQRSSSHRSHSRCASRSRTPKEREVTLKRRIWQRPPSW